MALIRTQGAGGSALTYTMQEIAGGVPIGGKTIDLSSYGNIAFVAFSSGNPETSQTTPVAYNSYLISNDGGNSSAISVKSNRDIGGLTLANKSLTIANNYSAAITDSYLVVGTI